MRWLEFDGNTFHDAKKMEPAHGVGRLLYLLIRDLWSFVKANVLCVLCYSPSVVAGGVVLLLTRNYMLCGLLALAFSPLVGAGMCGLHRTVNRSMRGRGENARTAFSKGFRDNFRDAVVPGILTVLQLWLFGYMLLFRSIINAFAMPVRLWIALILCWLFLQILLQNCFVLLVVVHLSLRHLLKNTLILFMTNLKRNMLCLLMTSAWSIAGILLLPKSLIVIGSMGIAVGALLRQYNAWPYINEAFSVETRQEELEK